MSSRTRWAVSCSTICPPGPSGCGGNPHRARRWSPGGPQSEVPSDSLPDGLIAAETAISLVSDDPAAAARAARAVLESDAPAEARVVALRALGLARAETDDLTEAARTLRSAVALARRHVLPDREAQARLSLAGVLVRRGDPAAALRQLDAAALVAWRGETAAGVRDLQRCLALATEHGHPLLAADAAHNLGYAAARAGDVPGALAAFDRAEQMPGITAGQRAITCLDRAQTLLEARLAVDAAAEARRAIAVLEPLGHGLDVGIAWLLLAEAALLAGEADAARVAAQRAVVGLRGQHGGLWPAMAAHTQTAARVAAGEHGPAVLRALRANVTRLDRAGWPEPAVQARILCAGLLREAGRTDAAAEVLRPAAAARHRGPAGLRAAAWHAEALRRADCGDRVGALSAARSGLQVVEQHLDALGAADLRAHAAGHGVALAELGLHLALAAARPAAAPPWADRGRRT